MGWSTVAVLLESRSLTTNCTSYFALGASPETLRVSYAGVSNTSR